MNAINTILRSACAGALALGLSGVATAQEKYMGEVFLTATTFCPNGTFEARGQMMSIAQHTALFALLGTNYGGDGVTTFGLPDLRGRVPVGVGNGPGLDVVVDGQVFGTETAQLMISNMPQHNHVIVQGGGASVTVRTAQAGDFDSDGNAIETATVAGADGTGQVSVTGGSLPFPIRDPSLGMRFCVVESGIYPSRP